MLAIFNLLILTAIAFSVEGKFSGIVFGDYYYILSSHNPELEDQNGFWFRRVYLTYDRNLHEQFDMRVRLEMAHPGLESSSSMTPFVKDAYLRWKLNRHQVYFGISQTPTSATSESAWGYRSLEKIPADFHKFGGAQDLGIAIKGALDEAKKFRYHFMIGNGNGVANETTRGKKFMLALNWLPTESFLMEIYGDFIDQPGPNDWFTYHALGSFEFNRSRAGLQFVQQIRQQAKNEDINLSIGSAFVVTDLNDRTGIILRIDRLFDPSPAAGRLPYLPFADAKATFLLAGIDFQMAEDIHFIPNAEIIFYDKPDSGPKPEAEVMPRFTIVWSY